MRLNCLLFIRNNFFIPTIMKQRCMLKIIKISKKFSLTYLKKFCIITGRVRFILSQTSFSRITFKELASSGLLLGVFAKNPT